MKAPASRGPGKSQEGSPLAPIPSYPVPQMSASRLLAPALCAAAIAGSLALLPGTAHAAPPTKQQIEEAMPHFSKAVELYDENDFANALIEFKRAYEISTDYHVLFNVAQAYYQVQDYAGALDSFRQYLDEGGNNIAKDRRKYCDKEIKKLEGRVAQVTVHVNVDGADILVDDEKVGTSPLDKPLTVSQGRRKISISMTGRTPEEKVVEVAGGDTTTVDFNLPDLKKAIVPVTPPPPVTHRRIPWVAWGITGGLGVAAGVMGGVALAMAGDYASSVHAPDEGNPPKVVAAISDVLWGCTAVAAGVSLVLTLTAKPQADDKTPPPPAASAKLVVGPAGAWVTGKF